MHLIESNFVQIIERDNPRTYLKNIYRIWEALI